MIIYLKNKYYKIIWFKQLTLHARRNRSTLQVISICKISLTRALATGRQCALGKVIKLSESFSDVLFKCLLLPSASLLLPLLLPLKDDEDDDKDDSLACKQQFINEQCNINIFKK